MDSMKRPRPLGRWRDSSERHLKERARDARRRAANRAKGLTSRGTPYKRPGWKAKADNPTGGS